MFFFSENVASTKILLNIVKIYIIPIKIPITYESMYLKWGRGLSVCSVICSESLAYDMAITNSKYTIYKTIYINTYTYLLIHYIY